MICESCKKEVAHQIFNKDKWVCSFCCSFVNVPRVTWQSAGNPHKPWMTMADRDTIRNRVVCQDDRHTIIDRRTGKETRLVQKHR